KVVIAGRWVSASFAAIFVVAVSFIGYVEAGIWGMLIVALIAGSSPSVQAHAHYMKEDTVLLAGVGIFLLGTRLSFVRFHSRWSDAFAAIILGIGCALATSGKYVGAFTILPAWLLLFGWQRRWWTS